MCKQAAHMVKNKTTPPPSPAPPRPRPPHCIDMHSWPGRCKNRLAAPELEMVTEGSLQLLGFNFSLTPGKQPADGENGWRGELSRSQDGLDESST